MRNWGFHEYLVCMVYGGLGLGAALLLAIGFAIGRLVGWR